MGSRVPGPLAAAALTLLALAAHVAEPLPLSELAKPGRVLMLRHANAPGIGDPPMVLVTHQFTIAAFSGQGTVSGGGTVFELNGSAMPRVLGEIAPE